VEKLAFVFAGAGHSYLGMGQDLYETLPETRTVFDQVSDLAGIDIARLCFEGPEQRLRRYREGLLAQLALGIACYQVVSSRGVTPHFLCAPCAGQVIAWVAADAVDLACAVKVFEYVCEQVHEAPMGLLARIVGLDLQAVQEICYEVSPQGVIDIAVIMGPGVINVSGQPRPVRAALALARERGADDAAPLPIEPRPAHSRLVGHVSQRLLSVMEGVPFRDPKFPIISSLDGQPMRKAEELLPNLAKELSSTSNWQAAVQWLTDHSVNNFLSLALAREIVRLADKDAVSLHVRDVQTLESTMTFLWEHNML
jgi:[acyl-carrier-protein] S-malonyltransferase